MRTYMAGERVNTSGPCLPFSVNLPPETSARIRAAGVAHGSQRKAIELALDLLEAKDAKDAERAAKRGKGAA
jgi:hypothetical protein